MIVFRSQHLHICRTARRKELRSQLSEQILQQRIQILSRLTMASRALSDSAFLDGMDLIMRQNPVSFYYAFAYSHRQHIIFPLLCTNSIHFFSFIVSVLALISSIQIGRKQYELSKWQAEAQNKVELYLLTQPITLKSADGIQPDQSAPAIYIRNVGGNVIYLERYLLNGREYPLGKEVLQPMSVCEGYRYVYLPTDGTTHVSLQIYFEDWQKKQWTTKGVADWEDGIWKITYQPCVRCAEQLLTRKKQICKP